MCEAKESAEFSCMEEIVRSCANCINYGWTQAPEESRLFRCSRCKFIRYCSKECQQEHWVKVHKQHCKYLAEQKVMSQSRHDPASCPGCIKQTEIGILEMSKADNPVLGCTLAINFVPLVLQPDCGDGCKTSAPIPFQLGEMTGQFLTKAEHTVSLLGHLLHKMKVTNHAAWTIHPEARDNMYTMYRIVSKMRQVIWSVSIYFNPGHHLDIAIERNLLLPSSLQNYMDALINVIDNKLAEFKLMDQSVFRLWDTYKLTLNILRLSCTNFIRKDAETVGLTEMSEDVQMARVTSDQFSDMWRRVLDAMPGKLVPYTELLKIVCGGQLSQVCYGCSKDITVSQVIFPANRSNSSIGTEYFQSDISASVCGDPSCDKKVVVHDIFVTKMYMKISSTHSGNKCDNCALPSSGKIHRCTRCLTKLYCGVECRDEDYKVHKLVCKKGDEWKMKVGKQDRKQVGANQFDRLVEGVKNMDLNDEQKNRLKF